jgi:hypothetical protein
MRSRQRDGIDHLFFRPNERLLQRRPNPFQVRPLDTRLDTRLDTQLDAGFDAQIIGSDVRSADRLAIKLDN